jgi:hypothetical protein
VERRRRIELFETWRDGLLATVAAALLIWAGAVVVGSRLSPVKAGPKMNGAYDVMVAGCGTGTGKAVVTPKMVKIDATLTDKSGNVLALDAKKLDIDTTTYHFKGDGTLDGIPCTISGRLDPDDTSIKNCRITATFLATDGRGGRVVGEHK